MAYSQNLARVMRERDVSQAKLSNLTGIGKSSISQYLSGKNEPKAKTATKIAEALGVSADLLNGPETDTNGPNGFKNVPVKEAAKRLGVCEQSVRVGLIQGKAPYGYAIKASSKHSYHISEKLLNDYIGT